ncbi:MAG: hypothetical protein ACI90V_011246, partial [Bacillariaceae sp.]
MPFFVLGLRQQKKLENLVKSEGVGTTKVNGNSIFFTTKVRR